MATTYNHGEPIFDQTTGEPVVDPVTGDFVEVAPGYKWINPLTGVQYDGDDVANAAYFRANIRVGECFRDASVGVDYINYVFSGAIGIDVAIGEVGATLRTTPGVQSISGVRNVDYNGTRRTLTLEYVLTKKSGEAFSASTQISG